MTKRLRTPQCHTGGHPVILETWKSKCKEVICAQLTWGRPCAEGTHVGINRKRHHLKSVMVKEINVSLRTAQ